MVEKITILGERPYVVGLVNFGFFIRKAKIILFNIKNYFKKNGGRYYPCHKRVSEEVFEGLLEIGIIYKVDPLIIKKKGKYLILGHARWLNVLSAVQAKRNSLKVIVGPNTFTRINTEMLPFIRRVDAVILTPSEWVAQNYIIQVRDANLNIRVWACGIDEINWMPRNTNKKRETVIIYRKHDNFDEEAIDRIKSFIDCLGLKTIIVNYGSYSFDEWKKYLGESLCVIYLTSYTESQGIAQFEAWSMNVPLFVFNITECSVAGWNYVGANSSPYLNPQCGELWTEFAELFNLLKNLSECKKIYNPRKYIIDNFTRRSKSLELLSYFDCK